MKKILILILSLVFAISLVGCEDTTEPTEQETKKEVKEEVKEEPLNKVDFNGWINPTVATVGEKVIIKIEVENLDETKPINDIGLLFTDDEFLEEGLTVVNVMSGGVQDGTYFEWKNEGTKIPPKEKRFFQIVAVANQPGNYESAIGIMPAGDFTRNYTKPNGNEELVAKLTVINK